MDKAQALPINTGMTSKAMADDGNETQEPQRDGFEVEEPESASQDKGEAQDSSEESTEELAGKALLAKIDPDETAAHAFAELDKEEDALPSPEDTAFFDLSEADINKAAKDDRRKARKRRGVGLKIAITIVVLCILVVIAGAAAYILGYGYPTQEAVTEEFLTAAQSGEDLNRFWAGDVDEASRSSQAEMLSDMTSHRIEAVERSMSQTAVYVKSQITDGAELYYEIVLSRDALSWKVLYVELYFPSAH